MGGSTRASPSSSRTGHWRRVSSTRATPASKPLVVDHRQFAARDDFDRALAAELTARNVAVVCLAGFMRLVGAELLEAFPNAILNVHPSLLPAFPGVDAQRQALAARRQGRPARPCISSPPELDAGPIVVQAAVPVHDDDTVETLSARILVEEHRIYPEAVRTVLDGRWQVEGRRFTVLPDRLPRRRP